MSNLKLDCGEFQSRREAEMGRSGVMTWLHANERGPRWGEAQPLLMIERMGLFPSAHIICRQVKDPLPVLEFIRTLHADRMLEIDKMEGLMQAKVNGMLDQLDGRGTERAGF